MLKIHTTPFQALRKHAIAKGRTWVSAVVMFNGIALFDDDEEV